MLTNKQIIIINLVMALILLLCLFDMPYGYYQLVRFISAAVFGLYAYHYYEKEEKLLFFIFLSLAVLFQPLIKIKLGRDIWNFVDVAVALWLIYLAFKARKNK